MGENVCAMLRKWILSRRYSKKALKEIQKKFPDYSKKDIRLALVFLNEDARLSKYMVFITCSVILVSFSLWLPFWYLVDLNGVGGMSFILLNMVLSFLCIQLVRPLFYEPLILARKISRITPNQVSRYFQWRAKYF
ncbi:MAG: hypothetical protein NE330_08560 [Lentisphaeraceae bacterium]|nr:hypothetical protein [Lentisphaeraceae bacterium]